MQRDLQIIGDRIEFMGYHVGNLLDMPATVRERFERKLDPDKFYRPYIPNKAKK